MPCRKPVPTLQFFCNQSIVKNFKILEASLQFLPCDLLVDFYEEREKLNFDVRPLPLIFINQRTRHLEKLEEFGRTKINGFESIKLHVLERLCTFSTKITHLNLTNSTSTPEHLTLLMHCVPQVRKLILTKTTCNASVLEAIGNRCTDILLLNLGFCKNVGDSGIEALCTINSTSRNKKITELNLIKTSVTVKGFAIALRNLPQLIWFLRIFKIQNPSEEFTDIDRDFASRYVPFEIQTGAHLKFASKLCPNATFFMVHLNDDIWLNREKVIEAYRNVDKIDSLIVCGNYQPNAVVLVERNFSRDLTSIQIDECCFADIFTVCRCFPHLKRLIIWKLVDDPNAGTNFDSVRGFQSLTVLKIDFCLINVGQNNFEKLLVSCKSLEELMIKKCKDLTDGVVKRVVEENPLNRLLTFFVFRCDVITVESLLMLLTKNNRLSKIMVTECENISERDILIVKNKARECNFDLSVFTDIKNWNLDQSH